ncbi:hypothetical protein [Vibrio stylophorae]|nr:hypothetical protein [Vibrio stylophorae]
MELTHRPKARWRRSYQVAAGWGFAEATLFFIVPDVWLSYLAQKSYRHALVACFMALLGALLGGLLLYWLGSQSHMLPKALHGMDMIPAISSAQIKQVALDLEQQGVSAMLLGPLSGTPYKLYALQSAQAGIPLVLFLLISIPARLIRFVLVTSLCAMVTTGLRRLSQKRGTPIPVTWVLFGCWCLFYLLYFSLMPN